MNSLSYVIFLIITFFPTCSIMWLLLPSLPISLSGGCFTINLLCNAIVSDNSSNKTRSTRFSILQFVESLGIGSGYLIGVLLFNSFGYWVVFATTIMVHTFALVYTAARLQWDFNIRDSEKESIVQTLRKSMKSVTGSQNKFKILLLVISMCICQLVKGVDTSTAYLYTRHQFGWGPEDYSYFVMLLVLSGSLGTILVLPVLSLLLEVDDCVLGIMGTLSWVDFHLVMGLAQGEWLLYLSTAFAVLKDCTNVTIRSILSKLSANNSSSLFSLLACMEALVPLVAAPLSDWVYTVTLSVFPGSVFMLTAGVLSGNIIVFSIIFCLEDLVSQN